MEKHSLSKISLFKDVARNGFHTSIVTTYSVDAAFYDGALHQRLRTHGCENNILMADANMLQRAIQETPESFSRAGSAYAVMPITVRGCFHPKICLRLGLDGGRLIVGSANATVAGWGRNREIAGAFEWSRRDESEDAAASRLLIRKGYDYLAHWLDRSRSRAISRKLDMIERDAAWLFEHEANADPLTLTDGTRIDILFERSDDGPGLLARFLDLLGDEPVRRLTVMSPYWDASFDALAALHGACQPDETVIALSARNPELAISALPPMPGLRLAGVFDGADAGRFIHAKLFIVETDVADHVLFGSANCSGAALGLPGVRTAVNAECSIYRRLPPGTALDALGLDLSSSIDADQVRAPLESPATPLGPQALAPGLIEASEKTIRWRPAARIEAPDDAKLVLDGETYGFVGKSGEFHILTLPERPTFPIIARILLSDGRLTSAVLVNDEARLARAAPGMGDRRLRAAFERLDLEEGDLLELASLAAIIFSGTPERAQARLRRHASRSGDTSEAADDEPEAGQDYESPAAFRAAMLSRVPARGESGRLNFDDPDAVNLLRIILRGIGESAAPDHEQPLIDQEPIGDDTDNANGDSEPPEASPRPPKLFTTEQADKRSIDLLRAMDCFDAYIGRLAKDEKPPPRRLTAETCFMLRLMVHACRKPLEVADGEQRSQAFALDLVPTGDDRERAFVVRAGQMLQRLWVGSKTVPALLSRITIGGHQQELPFDCFALIAITRWALARSILAMGDARLATLRSIVQRNAIAIWRATLTWPPLDQEAELAFVARLDETIGVEASETQELLVHYRQLAAQFAPPQIS